MSERRKQYPFDIIEPKWQNHWDNNNTFKTSRFYYGDF